MLHDAGQDVRRGFRTNAGLLDEWQRRHRLYIHEQQKKIHRNPADTRCLQLGTCVCGKTKRSSDAWRFFLNLREVFKRVFWKQQQRLSPERELLAAHAIVFQFETDATAADAGDGADLPASVWLHPGYVHYGTWQFAAVHLQEVASDLPEEQAVVAVRWLQVLSSADDPAASRTQTCIDHVKTLLDLEKAWAISMWRISEEERDWPLDETSSTVPVRACDVERAVVWRGLAEQGCSDKKSKKRAAPEKRGQGKKPRASNESHAVAPVGDALLQELDQLEMLDAAEATIVARTQAADPELDSDEARSIFAGMTEWASSGTTAATQRRSFHKQRVKTAAWTQLEASQVWNPCLSQARALQTMMWLQACAAPEQFSLMTVSNWSAPGPA